MSSWTRNSLNGVLWQDMFYTTFTTVRTAIITPCLVVMVFVVLRAAGTRTLTQTTLFNKIVSVAVGSVVGQVALRPTSPLTAAVIATIIIVVGALLVDMAYVNGLIPNSVVQVQPVLLYTEGRVLHQQLCKCLLTPEKLAGEMRKKGHSSWENIHAVVLEPSGTFSVITEDTAKSGVEFLEGVGGYNCRSMAPAGAQAEDEPDSRAQHSGARVSAHNGDDKSSQHAVTVSAV